MDLQLEQTTALVTGSTTGIGYAIARFLAREGVEVILNGRSKQNIDVAIEKLEKATPDAKVWGIEADFGNPSSVENLINHLPTIDILVNNVGIYTSGKFTSTTDNDWYHMFEVNVMSGARLSRALLPGMMERDCGRIIFIASECVSLVPNDLIAYSSTKAAVMVMARGLAQLTGGTSVRVNTVVPGSILTEGAEGFLKKKAEEDGVSLEEITKRFFKEERPSSILGQFGIPEDVAHAVAYLASPVSSATNGSTLNVDGGSVPGVW